MKNKLNIIQKATTFGMALLVVCFFVSCQKAFEFELPESNSKADETPPEANFSYASSIDDFRTIKFTDLSFEAISYSWDFGGGNTSTDQDPTFTFAGEGTYPVSLTATDGLGASDMITIDVLVVEGPFQPIILEPGFEDNTLPDGSGDGRDSWRNSDLGGVIQITGSPVTFGDQGAKLPDDQTRVGYQEIVVEPDQNYDLRFWYTMKDDSSDPWVVVSILGVTQFGSPTTTAEALAANIGSITVTDTEDPDTYVEQKMSFNSGPNNIVAIYFYNGPVEARLDDFSIEVGAAGAVPPSAGFDAVQSAVNFLEYTFENTSTNATSYMWDFGDTNTSTDESPIHVYDTPDTYTVTLEVTSDNGLSTTLTKDVDIQAPTTADFTWMEDDDDYKTIHFMDASEGAVELLWEFGDGYQFTGMNPEHTYMDDGIYTVTLTSTSITGLQDSKSIEVTVALGFIASILESGFEDNSLPDGTGDGRDSWRNSDLGGVIQITGSPVTFGSQAAKLPSDGSRIGYQLFEVEADTDYDISFHYTMKDDNPGTLTVSILDGTTLTDPSEIAGATIVSGTYSNQDDPSAYLPESLSFNSGSNTMIAIYFNNEGVECRIDEFEID